ncbi:hypothetical protein KIH87_19240 [Paraneptunicella aestuarii]|uniref:hypothetical protein n=1 Tax=Paraneptunicella aestuarii TaxID=2831148 RepID=UPI001E4F65E5|nr:hypothetical protein [Paraneptunicella aestuarii]UAA38766.1 hypothetical protein KIH87_19240 [Paraneptunicella aestuarii]
MPHSLAYKGRKKAKEKIQERLKSTFRAPTSGGMKRHSDRMGIAVGKDMQPQMMTRRSADQLSKRGEKVKFIELPKHNPRHTGGSMLSMRARGSTDGNPTTIANTGRVSSLSNNKDYKQGTVRIHWKGHREDNGTGRTSGIGVHTTQRSTSAWPSDSEAVRTHLSNQLMAKSGFTPLDNSQSRWGAELSHLVAGSLHGPNDELSAQAASVHQNTEFLAIESGLKSLREKHGDQVRFKATGYVHDSGEHAGTLKAARFKIYIGGRKVFDHLTEGHRGNIDKDEATALRSHVSNLTAQHAERRPQHSKHAGSQVPGPTAKGVHGNAPSRQDVADHIPSVRNPMFTDVTARNQHGQQQRLSKQQSSNLMQEILSKARRDNG